MKSVVFPECIYVCRQVLVPGVEQELFISQTAGMGIYTFLGNLLQIFKTSCYPVS